MICVQMGTRHLGNHGSLMILLAMLLGACSPRAGPEEGPSMPFPVASVRGTWPVAVQKAQEWRVDAYVADVDVSFKSDGESGAYDEISFGFESSTDRSESLLIVCRDNLCMSIVVPQNPDIAAQHLPIILEDFKLDAKEALDISLQHGASRFVDSMPDGTISAFVKLSHMYPQEPDKLTWRAAYLDLPTREYLYVIVDAKTGELVEVME
jgi:hypothetical protein